MPLCPVFYVRLDANGYPQPGTMQSYNPTNLPCDSICQYAKLQTVPYTPPAGFHQCVHPEGIRFFYKISNRTGKIIPNSMVEMLEYPTPSKDNVSCYLEFKKYCSN